MILAFVCGCLAGCYCQLTYAAYEQLGVVRSIDTEIAESALDRTITSQRNVCLVTWLPHGSLSKQSWIYCVVLKRTVLNSRTLESY